MPRTKDPKASRMTLRHLLSSLCRWEEKEGTRYLVAPTVLMTEGVHNGLLYPADELAKFPKAWNGRPVVVQHPTENGEPVSAGDPDIMTYEEIGRLFNCRWVGGDSALKGEVWIEEPKALKHQPEILDMLANDQTMDVSTGVFVEEEPETGMWGNENYEAIARNHRPDHFALLPGGKGACSWEDGAGIPRLNRKLQVLQQHTTTTNELSQDSIRMALASAAREATDKTAYVLDVFQTHFIYDQYSDAQERTVLWRQGYNLAADDSVELVGDRAEVQVEVNYVPVPATNASIAGTGGEDNGSEPGDNKTVKTNEDKVNAIIACEANAFTEEDREMLMGLDEKVTDGLVPTENQESQEEEDEGKEGTQDPKPEANTATETDEDPVTFNKLLESADPEMRESVQAGLQMLRDQKAQLIAGIKANKANEFSDAELGAMNNDQLKRLAKLATPKDFSGQGTPGVSTAPVANDAEGVPDMPEIEWSPGDK